MATVTATVSTLHAGTVEYVKLTNTGTLDAIVSGRTGAVIVGPGSTVTYDPDGEPVTARTAGGSTTVTVTAGPSRDQGLPGTGTVAADDLNPTSAGFRSVMAYGAAGDGVTDDTAALQAALDDGGTVVIPRLQFRVTSTLLVDSHTRILAHGATINLIGHAHELLRNRSWGTVSGDRQQHITIEGGHWTRDTTASDKCLLSFNLADHILVQDLSQKTEQGKFGIFLTDVTDATVRRIHFDNSSDGVHVTGPAQGILIETIRGTTGDDFVAVLGRDYTSQEIGSPANRYVTDVVVRDLQAEGTHGNLFHCFGGLDSYVKRITVENVQGSTVNANLLSIIESTLYPQCVGLNVDDMTIRNISGATDDGAALVLLAGAGAGSILIDGISATATTDMYGVRLMPTFDARSLVVRSMSMTTSNGSRIFGVNVDAGATVSALTVDGMSMALDPTKAKGYGIQISSPNVGQLTLSNVAHMGGIGMLLHNAASGTTKINQSNVSVAGATYGYNITSGSVSITSSGYRCDGIGALVGSSASLTYIGGESVGASMYRTGTPTMRVNDPTVTIDIAYLTPSSGDRAINSNAASGPSGAVIYDGARWKHAAAGYVKTGTATLVGGTVTISDTSITTASQIRLRQATLGGTPGAVYVSAKVASTSFTITSTSASDTSVIAYEVVQY